MKKISIPLEDLLIMLEALQDNGCNDIVIFEHEGMPAIADINNPDDLITFRVSEEDEETSETEKVH